MNEVCSSISRIKKRKYRILEPEPLLCLLMSDLMSIVSNHTFSTDGTLNDHQIRNMQESVSIVTEPIK